MVYSIFYIVDGPSGLLAYKALEGQKAAIEKNLDKLSLNGIKLEGRMKELTQDPEAIRLEGRALGYYNADEAIIRIEGYQKPKSYSDAGTIIRVKRPENGPLDLYVVLSCSIALGILFWLTIRERKLAYVTVRKRT
jgi:hypothetical protein